MKKILLGFLFLFLSAKPVYADEAAVLIINQIRGGEECCLPGKIKFIDNILKEEGINKLPFSWALRFDALMDNNYLKPLGNNKSDVGLLLEVTPRLASASGVTYKGKTDGHDWYYAKNAFLIGYTIEERKKIIDTLFAIFKEKFGFYPSFTVSWMIDGWSLSYLRKTYQVKLHELTKEQYETDAYTLDGGIFNAPYYPSIDYPLIPGYGSTKLDLIIVRQTISDLLRNYGTSKAIYTSQPNDYLQSRENLDFSYFKSLVSESINQLSDMNFALLGLENSFSSDKYSFEYLKQLKHIVSLIKEKKIIPKTPSQYAEEFRRKYPDNIPFYLTKNFAPNNEDGVLWHFGKTYRARILKKGRQFILDDLRNFLLEKDPYYETPVSSDYAYWIIPYLIDASQQYHPDNTQEDILKRKGLLSRSVLPDIATFPFGIVLGEGDFTVQKNEKSLEIKISGRDGGVIKLLPEKIIIEKRLEPAITFDKTKIAEITEQQKEKTYNLSRHFDWQIIPLSQESQLGYKVSGEFVPLFKMSQSNENFELSPLPVTRLDLLSPLFQPDRSYLMLDQEKSVFYWHNQKAVTGRNPIRLFILPLNILGRPAKVEKAELKFTPFDPSIKVIYPDDYTYRVSPWFIDIFSEKPMKTSVSVFIGGKEIVKNVPIEFVVDCRNEIKNCFLAPQKLIKYLQILIEEKLTTLISFFKNWQ